MLNPGAHAASAAAMSSAFETYLNAVLPLKLRNEELREMRAALEAVAPRGSLG